MRGSVHISFRCTDQTPNGHSMAVLQLSATVITAALTLNGIGASWLRDSVSLVAESSGGCFTRQFNFGSTVLS